MCRVDSAHRARGARADPGRPAAPAGRRRRRTGSPSARARRPPRSWPRCRRRRPPRPRRRRSGRAAAGRAGGPAWPDRSRPETTIASSRRRMPNRRCATGKVSSDQLVSPSSRTPGLGELGDHGGGAGHRAGQGAVEVAPVRGDGLGVLRPGVGHLGLPVGVPAAGVVAAVPGGEVDVAHQSLRGVGVHHGAEGPDGIPGQHHAAQVEDRPCVGPARVALLGCARGHRRCSSSGQGLQGGDPVGDQPGAGRPRLLRVELGRPQRPLLHRRHEPVAAVLGPGDRRPSASASARTP